MAAPFASLTNIINQRHVKRPPNTSIKRDNEYVLRLHVTYIDTHNAAGSPLSLQSAGVYRIPDGDDPHRLSGTHGRNHNALAGLCYYADIRLMQSVHG